MKKVCVVGIIGRPNVGKSTLMNNILGQELAIVSPIIQTTRNNIRGIYNDKEYQIVFVDTPGVHKANALFNQRLNQQSFNMLNEVDAILFLTPANEVTGLGDRFIIKKINSSEIENKLAIITKIDLVDDKNRLDQKAEDLKDLGFKDIFGAGLNLPNTYADIINHLKTFAYEGEPFYEDEEQYGDVDLRFMAQEFIREAALQWLTKDLPHSIAVKIDDFIEEENKPYNIFATIYVKRESQKGILIGKGASMIKNISMYSRKKMEKVFGHKVYLIIRVKVSENWTEKEEEMKKLGY
ncbi:GTP-binding protein Era [Metamycoplasma subdolum]|uniref:GTPase Era n=1 Tax=Metamycoplasma subdolum TaxID=92407 RepID=A0A3L9ZYZ2_9BACT|nr:GTPase Era [Metamycoplasma subdolum]RMA77587.1 GTP-binding protein Era [Metamycoplasma subdolum]WPB50381.1 GTPase Era [Metamycoplasma subdolum]